MKQLKVGEVARRAGVSVRALHYYEVASSFLPNDEATHAAVMQLMHDEPQARRDHGLDDALFAYLGRALTPGEHADQA